MEFPVSEDDIRTKVVYPWLVSCGFEPGELFVEFSFEIRLGRQAYRIGGPKSGETATKADVARPRADVLVRRGTANLFVVEVKAPDEPIDDEARDQGITYARLLPQIAPFVVVTNGKVTKVYDSISRVELTGTGITPDHPAFKAGYQVSGDELHLRAEALEAFNSLSPANLLRFCELQLTYRMRRLRDSDPTSGKKYIPSLYVDRPVPRKRLEELLDIDKARVVAVTGKPQVGKTNFLCRFAEDRIKAGHPILFYPAISLNGSLLNELADDFGWLLGGQNSVPVLVAKISRVLQRTGCNLTIVIDGWNEADVELARKIDQECERVCGSQHSVQWVISFTNSAAKRLLTRGSDPSFIAEETGIGTRGCELIEIDPSSADRQKGWKTLSIGLYGPEEQCEASKALAREFNVQLNQNHPLIKDPYLLGVAMRHFAGQKFPDNLVEPEILGAWLEARIDRYPLSGFDVRAALTELGQEMLTSGCPLPERTAKRCWGLAPVDPIPPTLAEMALLAFLGGSTGRFVDFYNSRDRDFVIACWAGNWPAEVSKGPPPWQEFARAAASRAGIETLAWFFGYLPHLNDLLNEDGSLPEIADTEVRRLFLTAVRQVVWAGSDHDERDPDISEFMGNSESWAGQCAAIVSNDESSVCKIEAIKLMIALVADRDELHSIIPTDALMGDVVHGLLETHQDDPISPGGLGGTVLEVMRQLHMDESHGYDDSPSRLTSILEEESKSPTPEIREAAFAVLGGLRPRTYIREVLGKVSGRELPEEYLTGLKNALQQIDDSYYGDPICPSYMSYLTQDPDVDQVMGHCQDEHAMLSVLSRFVNIKDVKEGLVQLFDDLKALLPAQEAEKIPPFPHHDAIGQHYLFADEEPPAGS